MFRRLSRLFTLWFRGSKSMHSIGMIIGRIARRTVEESEVGRMRKVMAWLATAFVIVASATVGGASPAQAASWTDCPGQLSDHGYVCLWENAGYLGGRWQAPKDTLAVGSSGGVNGCHNLTGSSYTNGHPVYDTAGALAIRKPPTFPLYYYVTFYEWLNCNKSGNYRTYLSKDQDYAVSDLSTLSPNWNDTIASIKVTLTAG